MSPRRRQILLLLSVLLLAALYYAWQGSPPQESVVADLERQKNHRTGDRAVAAGGAEIVALQSYQDPAGTFRKPQKNLFGAVYQERPASVKTVQPVQRVVTMPTADPDTHAVAPPFLPSFEVVGYIERANNPTVFVAGPDGAVHLLEMGSRFAGNALVRYLDRQQVVIALDEEQEPLILAIAKPETMRYPSQRQGGGRGIFIAAQAEDDEDDDDEDDYDDDYEDEDEDDDEEQQGQ